jgi:hypothetical protein
MNFEFNYKKLETATQPARFDLSDLRPFNKKKLREMTNVSGLTKRSDEVGKFFSQFNISSLNANERSLVSIALSKIQEEEIVALDDVHGYYLGKKDCYFTKNGLAIETPKGVDEKKEVIIEKQVLAPKAWTAPEELIKNFPGIQFIVGVAIACLKRTSEGLQVLTEDSLYRNAKVVGLDHAGLQWFGEVLKEYIDEPIRNMKHCGNGRKFIEQLFSAISSLGIEGYLVMHWMQCKGPLSPCFEWAIKQGDALIPTEYKRHAKAQWVVLSVKTEYASCFSNAAKQPAVERIRRNIPIGNILPIFVGALPMKFKTPPITSMGLLNDFVKICRDQRLTDEKGLSAYSCGFGASGNPTKIQLRAQKQISLILGRLTTQVSGERLVIFPASNSEAELVHANVQQWIKKCPKQFTGKYVFFFPQSSGMSTKMAGFITHSNSLQKGDHALYFSTSPALSGKIDKWALVDEESKSRTKWMMHGLTVEEAVKEGVHVTAFCHVQSETQFYSEANKTGYYVYGLGSIHNQYMVLSTLPELPLGASDGSSQWHFSTVVKLPYDVKKYYANVTAHNMGRSLFFLSPKFYFSPELNLIRRIPGKSYDWVNGQIEDLGIDIMVDLENMGDLGAEILDLNNLSSNHSSKHDNSSNSSMSNNNSLPEPSPEPKI